MKATPQKWADSLTESPNLESPELNRVNHMMNNTKQFFNEEFQKKLECIIESLTHAPLSWPPETPDSRCILK